MHPHPLKVKPTPSPHNHLYRNNGNGTFTDVTDQAGIPVARMDYSQSENDRKNIAYAKQTLCDIFHAADAQDLLITDRYPPFSLEP